MEAVLLNSFGSTHQQGDDTFGIAEEYLMVHQFSQINMPDDYNIPSHAWKRVKAYLQQHFPDWAGESEAMLASIAEFRQRSATAELIYLSNFVFLPTEALMAVLVLKTAL
jgi:hypothetical protein